MKLYVPYLSKTNLSFFGIQLHYKKGREASSQLSKQAQFVFYGTFFWLWLQNYSARKFKSNQNK